MKRSVVKVILAASVIAGIATVPAFAANWQETDGKWQYLGNDGVAARSQWVNTDVASYYIGDDGFMLTDTLLNINGEVYYLDGNGVMLKNSWKQVADENGEQHWYYFGEYGKAFRNKGDKFSPKAVNGNKYAFDADGRMLTGFLNEDGQVIEDGEDSYAFLNTKYYFGEDGAMYVNKWLEMSTTLQSDERTGLGMKDYSNYDEMWLYFDDKGKIVKAKEGTKTKFILVGEKNYGFDENGVMIPGFIKEDLAATGSDARKMRLAGADNDGALIKDRWTWAVPTDVTSELEYNEQEYSWWRTNSLGKVLKDGIFTVNGRKYAFDAQGRMVCGFVVMNENGKYGTHFEMDQWNSDYFLYSKSEMDNFLPAINRGNLYLFNADEFNDGSMMADGEYEVVLGDTTAVFGVSRNGKVYGSKSTLQKVKEKYYYNGLRLQADEEIGYGIVDVNPSPTAQEYVVVNSQGKVVRGHRVLIKDKEGYWIVIQNGKFVARLDNGSAPRWRNGSYWEYDNDSNLRPEQRYVRPITFSTANTDGGFTVFNYDNQ